MIVIGPAQPERLLSRVLRLRRSIAALPINSLGGEEAIGRPIDADVLLRFENQLPRLLEAFVWIGKRARPRLKSLKMALGQIDLVRGDRWGREPRKSMAL